MGDTVESLRRPGKDQPFFADEPSMHTIDTVSSETSPRIFQIGPDRVTIQNGQVILETVHPMDDWALREYCRTPIWFQDEKYFLRHKTATQKPYAMRYVLEPWNNEECGSGSVTEFFYNHATVAERDERLKSSHWEQVTKVGLVLVYPFLGLLWSTTKEKLPRFGIVPRTVTAVSMFMVFGLVLLEAVFAKLLIMGSLGSGQLVLGGILRAFACQDHLGLGFIQVPILWLDCAIFVFLLLDCIVRYGQHSRDSQTHWGFGEWLLPSRRKAGPD